MRRRTAIIGAVCVAGLGTSVGLVACGSDTTSVLDAGLPDTSQQSQPDTSVADNAVPAQDAGPDTNIGCVPADVSGFSAPPYVPATGAHQFLCSGNNVQFDGFWNSCYGGDASSDAACNNFQEAGANATCAKCLDTAASALKYGPVIDGVAGKELNLAGCVELTVNSDAGTQCAAKIQAAERCTDKACKTNCPITDPASRDAYVACAKQAATSGCATFTAAAKTCLGVLTDAGAGQIATCVTNTTDHDTFLAYAYFFCGS